MLQERLGCTPAHSGHEIIQVGMFGCYNFGVQTDNHDHFQVAVITTLGQQIGICMLLGVLVFVFVFACSPSELPRCVTSPTQVSTLTLSSGLRLALDCDPLLLPYGTSDRYVS